MFNNLHKTPLTRVLARPLHFDYEYEAPPFDDEYDQNTIVDERLTLQEDIFDDRLERYDDNRLDAVRTGMAHTTITDDRQQGVYAFQADPQMMASYAPMNDQYYDDEYTEYEIYEPLPRPAIHSRILPLLAGVLLFAGLAIFGATKLFSSDAIGSSVNMQANAAAAVNTFITGNEQQAAVQNNGNSAAAMPVASSTGRLAPIFMPTVMHWEWLIVQLADEYALDPNALATIMQIESCGDPAAQSWAGAMGLFQVMPFHFASGEDMLDPLTNGRRGAKYFAERMVQTNNNTFLSFAGYNGGHVAAGTGWDNWAAETQRYYTYGKSIYEDAQSGVTTSAGVQTWLAAGGQGLCNQAATRLGY